MQLSKSGTFAIVFALLAASQLSAAESSKQVARYTTVLFEHKFEYDRDPHSQKVHDAALAYLSRTNRTQLATGLRAVLRANGLTTLAGAGAAYAMAMENIDRSQNLRRLTHLHHHTSPRVEDSLPFVLGDLAIRLQSKPLAQSLIGMSNGEYDSECQAIAIHELFVHAPELVVTSVVGSKHLQKQLLELLPYGAWENEQPISTLVQIAKDHLSTSPASEAPVYRKISALTQHKPF